ncbi:MAG: Ig-like domain-containing protein [Eubacterium sp.]
MGKRVMKTILAMSMILCLAVGNMTVAQAAGSKKTVKATSVVLNKSVYTLKKGGTVKLKATIAPKKATTRTLLWSSSNKKVATVDKAGKVKAKKNGKATITVKVKSTSKKASCKIIVGTPVTKVSVAKSSVTLIAGQTSAIKASVAPKTATTKSVAYASSNKRVATVSSGGVIKAIAAGTAKITVTAKDGTGKKATVNVTVKPRISAIALSAAKSVIEVGDSLQINANIAPSNAGNKTLTSTSSNARVASVDAKGKVIGKAEGTAVIKAAAKDGSNKAGTFTVTVKSKNRPVTKITLSASENELWTGDESLMLQTGVEPADSTNKKLVYESSNPDVAAVSENGEVTAVSAGTATITAKATDGSNVVSNGVEITVKVPLRNLAWNEASENLAVIDVNAQEETIGVVPIPSTAVITEITYESKNPDIVTVSDEGVLKGKKNGKTDIIVKACDERGNTVKIEKEVTVGTSVTGLTLSPESCELLVGGTRALTATVQPETANVQTVTYSSTDDSVVSVDKNGLIHANAPGEASIIAKTTDGGFEKTCQVTVKAVETEKSVSSQSELDSALQDANLQVLKIAEKATDLSIGEGSYPNVSLIVNAPQGHIENRAVFRDITIQAISNTTFVEHATGNTIQYEATSGTVQIAEGASATVVVSGTENQQLSLVNDGTVSGLQISNAADVAISGASDQMIEVRASEDAENSTISTSKALNINSEAKLSLTLQSGAENTIATVTDETKIPEVQGLGSVPVTVLDSGNLETVVGENDGTEQSKKVKVSGDVRIGTEAAPGADVYIIPYSASITAENINDYLTSALHVQTDEVGKYQTEDISIGNYYMFVRFEGYMDVLETLVLTSAKDEIYYAEAITLIEKTTETTGSLRGTLYDAQTGQRVQGGITLKIRSGKNNLSGDALAETVTLADGSYQFAELPAGQYTIQVLDNRNDPDGSYVTASFHAVVEAGKDNTANSTITYILSSDQVRFVLTWGMRNPVPRRIWTLI